MIANALNVTVDELLKGTLEAMQKDESDSIQKVKGRFIRLKTLTHQKQAIIIACNLKRIRKKANLTQNEVAVWRSGNTEGRGLDNGLKKGVRFL